MRLRFWILLLFLTSLALAESDFEFVHPRVLPLEDLDLRVHKKAARAQLYVTKERLPFNLNAVEYDLYFKPYYPAPGIQYDSGRNFTFDGRLALKVQATNDSDRFVLNAYNFVIQSYKVVDSSNTEVPILSTSQDDTRQQLSLITNANGVTNGHFYNIYINYTGLINYYNDGGVYYTSYIDPQGVEHYMLATHMEPFSARKVFPGLDEPSYKANFTIHLEYPTSQVALSNMMETTPNDFGNGWSLIDFPTTPTMSSYLIAFAVGPYVYSSYVNRHNTLTRAWGWPGTEEYLQFASENAGECLYQLGEYTGIPFPLEKADQLGMPEFLAGAMENWGLIIYKYQYIAFNPQTMTTRDKEAAAKVMCHELAHQWFGDLVTTAWWDDLFLNEGFADYFMTFIQKSVYPEQATYFDTIQVLSELQIGLIADVSPGAHPLVYPDGPAFDGITYQKGASMLRMLSDVLSPSVFRTGIQNYLNKKQYSNAVDLDLFTTLTDVARQYSVKDWCGNNLNVTEFMQAYVHQINHPLIRYNNNQINGASSLTQEPFGNITVPSPYNYQWYIPIRTSSYNQTDSYLQWLSPTSCETAENNNIKKRALHYEIGSLYSATYGRIIYDDIGFDRVIQTIEKDSVPDNVMVTLLADEYQYLKREKAASHPYSYDRFLTLALAIFNTDQFIDYPSYSVYAEVQSVLEEIARVFRDSMDAPLITRLYSKLFTDAYDNLEWQDTNSWNVDTFSEMFLPWAVRYDISDVRNRTLNMFQNVKAACSGSSNGTAWCNPYSTNVRRAVYCGAAKYASAASDNFFRLLYYYNEEVVTNPYFYQEYMSILEGMSCTQNPSSLKTLIRLYATSPMDLFGSLSFNPVASDALYKYLVENPSIVNSTRLDSYLDAMTYNWASQRREQQFTTLHASLNLNTAQDLTFTKYYNRIRQQWIYRANDGLKILQWLYDNLVVIGRTPWKKMLDGSIQPTTYDVEIQPYIPGSVIYPQIRNMTFDGYLTLTFDLVEPATELIINSHRLIFEADSFVLNTMDQNNLVVIPLDVQGIRKDYDNGVLRIPTLNNTLLGPLTYTLLVNYKGFIFQNPDEGNYINTYYTTSNNKIGWIFATDFEGGPGVRSLMPCLDEPTYKAVFNVVVTHPLDMIALSNGLEGKKEVFSDGWMRTSFESSEKMSSYLLAICVGHFSNLAKVTKHNVLTRMWTWTGMEQYGEYGLNVSAGTLEFMTDYFSFQYPLPKLDVVALPQYTQGAGAMENFGLIIGEYSLYLIDPDYALTFEIADVVETAAHEVVHQWFGNTVTMDWWNDIFLNEGFAQYWYANGINWTYPNQEDFAIEYNRFDTNRIALQYDCIPGVSKPVISDKDPVFDYGPYYKGSALLNLLSNTLGPDVLQKGLVQYLSQYQLENTTPQDLWGSLTRAAYQANLTDWNGNPINVSDFMDPYTLQTSFPILRYEISGTSTVSTSQESCLPNGNGWNIPLLTQDSQATTSEWLANNTVWSRPLSDVFRIDNAGSSSFARTQYDDKTRLQIVQQLLNNASVFSPTTRAMLLDDAYFFFTSGRWNVSNLLDLTLYLSQETSLAPWEIVYKVFADFLRRFRYEEEDDIANYVIQTTKSAFNKFGFSATEQWTNNQISSYITRLNCYANNRACRQATTVLFNNFIKNCQYSQYGTGKCAGIGPDLRETTYCYGLMQSNNQSDIDIVDNLYQLSVQNNKYFLTEQYTLLTALGCIQNVDSVNRQIDGIISGQYPSILLRYIAENDQFIGLTLYQYYIANQNKVLLAPFDFSLYVRYMVLNWSTDSQYNLVQNYVNSDGYKNLNNEQQKNWSDGISQIESNRRWLQAYKQPILTWVQQHFGTVNDN